MYDLELLKTLYKIHAPSGREKKMRKFLKKTCIAMGCEVVQDKTGNLLVTKGQSETYPCVVSHIDQVQQLHSRDFEVFLKNDIIFAYSAKTMSQQGLGADDKNGIWICLMLLQKFDVLKCAFFVGEEIGCVGSKAVDISFFNDVRFVLQADRRNGGDFITDISGRLCSDEFVKDTHYKDFGYKETYGMMTDVETLCERGVGVSCINISCGYYNPHTDEECTNFTELCNALDLCAFIVGNCTKVYKHEYESYHKTTSKMGKYFDDLYGFWQDDYDYDTETMRCILESEQHLSFEEVMKHYGEYFLIKEERELWDIYCDVQHEMAK